MNDRVRRLAEAGMIAALYTALTWALAPISYGGVQFRVAEMLKGSVIGRPHLIGAFVVGNFAANLLSPFAGAWELIFMPAANLVGGYLAWSIGRRNRWLGAAAFATVIAVAVAVLLWQVAALPFWWILPGLLASEMILIVGGLPAVQAAMRAVNRRA